MTSIQVPKALVLAGDGINCEAETAEALRLTGFQTDVHHLNDLALFRWSTDELSRRYSVLAIPGGFSFGDDLGSGKVLALKMQSQLKWNLSVFAERGGMVIGICNGFQALIKLGIFGKDISISHNSQGKFLNTWTRVTPQGNKCLWLRGIGTLELPIRHGEGRILFAGGHRTEVFNRLDRHGMMCLRYEVNPNGTEDRLAGLCDSTGRIFGLMPHPEAFVRWTAHPDWTSDPERAGAPGQGLQIFQNAFEAVKSAL